MMDSLVTAAEASPRRDPQIYGSDEKWYSSVSANVAAGVIYLETFLHIYRTYISPTWEYTRLYYRPLTLWESLFQIALVGLTSAFLPSRIEKPSSLITWLLYAFVFVPTVAITYMVGLNPSEFYTSSLVSLSLGIIICAVVSKRGSDRIDPIFPPSGVFVNLMLGAFVLSAIVLYYAYRDILSFAQIDDVYTQRFAASEATGGALGYLRAYFTYVFSPALIAIGMSVPNRRWMMPLGIVGYLLSYMIDASKISLVIPMVMILLGLAYKVRFRSTAMFTGGIGAIAAISSLFTNYSSFVRYFVDLILLRSIAIPGQTFSLYYDLFEARGYTYWSNTKIVNLIVAPPPAFRADPYWPVLGFIVGANYYGGDSQLNANANPFSGEGVAAAGPIGVIVIACAVAYWLRLMDRYSASWLPTIALMIAVPLGLGLTNAHFTTMLLSFGGVGWLVALRFGLSARR